jgi:hypothetical protein
MPRDRELWINVWETRTRSILITSKNSLIFICSSGGKVWKYFDCAHRRIVILHQTYKYLSIPLLYHRGQKKNLDDSNCCEFRRGMFLVCCVYKRQAKYMCHGSDDQVPRAKTHVPHCPTLITRKLSPTGHWLKHHIRWPTCNRRNDPAFFGALYDSQPCIIPRHLANTAHSTLLPSVGGVTKLSVRVWCGTVPLAETTPPAVRLRPEQTKTTANVPLRAVSSDGEGDGDGSCPHERALACLHRRPAPARHM